MRCESGDSNGRPLVRAAVAIAAALLVLVLSAVPAFGQNGGGGGAQYDAICQNIIGEFGVIQNQTGNAVAAVEQYGDAIAEVAQEQGVSVAQVNECLNGAEGPGVRTTSGDDNPKAGVLAATIPDKLLPNTGGMPLVGLAAIGLAAVVAGVFVLRAVITRRS
jgi:hypothetical protein